jgi:hypothetical protein
VTVLGGEVVIKEDAHQAVSDVIGGQRLKTFDALLHDLRRERRKECQRRRSGEGERGGDLVNCEEGIRAVPQNVPRVVFVSSSA